VGREGGAKITNLVVGASAAALVSPADEDPSIEVMTAAGTEEALEKLARNRRIDAVLLLGDGEPEATAAAIHEEDPGAPPLFVPASVAAPPRVRPIDAASPAGLLHAIAHALSADG
jgi:hypothetical protein